MSEQQTQAASSPAEDVFGGQNPTFDEFNSYRQTGELPARFKPAEPADPAPADAPEEKVDEAEIAPESDPEEAQEPPQKGSPAQKRILQLLADKKELQRKLDAAAKPDAPPDPSPEPAQQQSSRPKPDDTKPDGTPKYKDWEDYNEALIDWKAGEKIAQFQYAQQQQAQLQVLKSKLDEARTRYDDADSVIFPAAQTILDAQIPPAIKEIFAQSEHFVDLCFVVGSDPAEMAAFIALARTNPRAALGKVFEYERGIASELAKAKEPDGGKAPEKKSTSAPKPPSPVSGGSQRAFDVSDESLSPDDWARKRNKQLGKV